MPVPRCADGGLCDPPQRCCDRDPPPGTGAESTGPSDDTEPTASESLARSVWAAEAAVQRWELQEWRRQGRHQPCASPPLYLKPPLWGPFGVTPPRGRPLHLHAQARGHAQEPRPHSSSAPMDGRTGSTAPMDGSVALGGGAEPVQVPHPHTLQQAAARSPRRASTSSAVPLPSPAAPSSAFWDIRATLLG